MCCNNNWNGNTTVSEGQAFATFTEYVPVTIRFNVIPNDTNAIATSSECRENTVASRVSSGGCGCRCRNWSRCCGCGCDCDCR